MHLKDEVIYKQKQEISSLKEESDSAIFMLKERINLLTAEIEQLRRQPLVKRETGESLMNILLIISIILFLDLTSEKKQLIPQIKTEPKEEAITVIKSQPQNTGIIITKVCELLCCIYVVVFAQLHGTCVV